MTKISFQVEDWENYCRDAGAALAEHSEELAADGMKIQIDAPFYRVCDEQGGLSILTARFEGKIIGYFISVVRAHPHYKDTLCAFEDAYFLSKEHRKGWTGVRLVREAEKALKARGVKKLFVMENRKKNLRSFFPALGYKETHITYAKWI